MGTAYWLQITGVQGGTYPFTWQLDSGGLPPGVQVVKDTISTWTIKGIPTTAGSYDFVLRVTDGGNPAQTASAAVNMTVR